jgi:bisphosphoglycerate-dependent phosphoglycerate mutase family 1
MKKELKIFLFRHGQTTFNRDGIFTGHLNPKLTKKGLSQARLIAKKLKKEKFQIAFHSKLTRSKQTLNEVLKFHPECTQIIEDDRIIERDYGNLNGTSHKSFVNMMGKRIVDLEESGDIIEDLSPVARKEAEKFLGEKEFELIHRGFYVPPAKGESFSMVEKRVRSFIIDLIKMMKKKHVNVAISAHGNSIRLFRKIMEKASIKETVSWTIPYDKYYTYKI